MAEREQIRKTPSRTQQDHADDTVVGSETNERMTGDIDDLLDEIDDVLETNAEEFVKSYVQKGGQ